MYFTFLLEEAVNTYKSKSKDKSASLRSHSVEEKMYFPDLLPENKRDILLSHNNSIPYKERLGLLMDLFLDGKDNANEFISTVGGHNKLFGLMTTMTYSHSVEFLVNWFSSMNHLPICPDPRKWRPYFMAAFNKEYAQWSMRKSQQQSRDIRNEEANMSLASMFANERQTQANNTVTSRHGRGGTRDKSREMDGPGVDTNRGSNGVKNA